MQAFSSCCRAHQSSTAAWGSLGGVLSGSECCAKFARLDGVPCAGFQLVTRSASCSLTTWDCLAGLNQALRDLLEGPLVIEDARQGPKKFPVMCQGCTAGYGDCCAGFQLEIQAPKITLKKMDGNLTQWYSTYPTCMRYYKALGLISGTTRVGDEGSGGRTERQSKYQNQNTHYWI